MILSQPFGLGDSPVQPLWCDACGEPTTADSLTPENNLICPLCAEMRAEAQSTEPATL